VGNVFFFVSNVRNAFSKMHQCIILGMLLTCVFSFSLSIYLSETLFRLTLLLGPPRSGKTTLLQALAGKLDRDLRVGHPLAPFLRNDAMISSYMYFFIK